MIGGSAPYPTFSGLLIIGRTIRHVGLRVVTLRVAWAVEAVAARAARKAVSAACCKAFNKVGMVTPSTHELDSDKTNRSRRISCIKLSKLSARGLSKTPRT
jgi:hypothetical protein